MLNDPIPFTNERESYIKNTAQLLPAPPHHTHTIHNQPPLQTEVFYMLELDIPDAAINKFKMRTRGQQN